MEGNGNYDPLLGLVKERLAGRTKSASTEFPPEQATTDTVPASASSEEIRNACVALNLNDMAAAA